MIRGNKQTKLRTERLYELYYYNSHPQGDGNEVRLCVRYDKIITTHTRKGMETFQREALQNRYQITTHTRKGMETVKKRLGRAARNYNSHPQGDGNTSP